MNRIHVPVLILANTGIRHGTEAESQRWKPIHLFEEGGLTFLGMSVSGKTGQRDLICRASTNLRQTFKLLMKHTALFKCPRTGQDRTLYSLRHTYATFALLNDGLIVNTDPP